jgi:uncharacterized repeat protein (TIGR02543 family)
MATVSKWTPFGVALDVTATGGSVVRKSATQFTVVINVSWETYYSGAQTNYGMTATSGGVTHTISAFNGTKRSSGSGSFTGTYSISGNGSATKSITVTFKNFNTDNGDSASKSVSFNVSVPAWTSYTVSYNANGGSGAPGSQTKWKDQTLTLSSTKPTRTGYSFLGWSTSKTATSATYSAGGSYTANSAATLYAVWNANTYTIKYNANGGSGAPGNQTKTYGTTLKLSSTVPTRANYTFLGWSTSASATSATYSAGGSYTANSAATLYAVWKVAYTKPAINNLVVERSNSSGDTDDNGTYIFVSFNWSTFYDATSAKITYKSSNGETATVNVSVSGKSGSFSGVIGNGKIATDYTYTVVVTVNDNNGSTPITRTVAGAKFVIDVLAGGKGAAIGKPAELEDVFDIAFKTRLHGGLHPIVLPAETDLNTVLTPNIYAGENTANYNYANCPFTSGTFSLEVVAQGPNGQIRQVISQCNKTSPIAYQRTYYTSAWGAWQLCTAMYDSGWIDLTIGSEFRQYGTGNAVRYRKIGNIVEVRGIVAPVAAIAGSTDMHTIATLPSGARPSEPLYAICQGSSNCTWLFRVNHTGTLDFSRYRNGDATATAGEGAWLPFQMTFMI